MSQDNGTKGRLITWIPIILTAAASVTGFCIWVNLEIQGLRHEIRQGTADRLSMAMFADIQQELSRKNPEEEWLTLRELRAIQARHLPSMYPDLP